MEKALEEHMQTFIETLEKQYKKEYQRGTFEKDLNIKGVYHQFFQDVLDEYIKEAKNSPGGPSFMELTKLGHFPLAGSFPDDIELVYVPYEKYHYYTLFASELQKESEIWFESEPVEEAPSEGKCFTVEAKEMLNFLDNPRHRRMVHQAELQIDPKTPEPGREPDTIIYHGTCRIEGYLPFPVVCKYFDDSSRRLEFGGPGVVQKDHPRWKEFYKWKKILIEDYDRQIREWFDRLTGSEK